MTISDISSIPRFTQGLASMYFYDQLGWTTIMQDNEKVGQGNEFTYQFKGIIFGEHGWGDINPWPKDDDYVRFNEAAVQGDTTAQNRLATCYFKGYQVQQDPEVAIMWLEKSADGGDFEAWVRLANCYFYGQGIKQNYTHAVKWLEKVAGHIFNGRKHFNSYYQEEAQKNAHYQLAYCYFHGHGVKKSSIIAIDWLEKAAEQGYVPAQISLADCYFQGIGVEINDAQAVKWLENAAGRLEHPFSPHHPDGDLFLTNNEDRLAQRKLGFYYFRQENYVEAIKWFKKAAGTQARFSPLGIGLDKELVCAQIELGICYYIAKNEDLAFDSFFRLSNENDGFVHLWLAYLTYIKIKSASEQISAIDRLLGPPTASGMNGLSDTERNELKQGYNRYKDILDNEEKITNSLYKTASALFLNYDDDDNNYFAHDMIYYAFPGVIIDFLTQNKSSPSKVILAFYNRCKEKKYNEYLKQASNQQDILAHYLLGKHYKDKNCFDEARLYFEKVENKWSRPSPIEYSLSTQDFLGYSAKEELNNIKHQEEIEEKNRLLIQAQKELEETMSMFAHKFRSPLDAIIYNTAHENQPKLYIQAAQTMRGLLDIFSIISTDADVLKEKLKQDCQGNGRLASMFSKTLDMILLHLLSASATEKIQQHYLSYAKANQLCDPQISYKTWNEEHYVLERQLQTEWEQSYARLLSESASIEHRLAWLEQHFFKLEVRGFESNAIQFKEYGVTESFLTILLNEVLVNAFKYYAAADHAPVVLEWCERDGFQLLCCRNPSIKNVRAMLKGSGKGHAFLSVLAHKTGSQFSKPKPQDDFVLEFGIANELITVN